VPAGTYDFNVDQGATFTATITWSDENGDPVNLTGYTARMQLRPDVTSSTVTLELLDSNGRIALGGAAGTITLTIAATDTAAIGAGNYVYDLELESGGGVVTRLLKGGVNVDAEVTR
jgi:hypothetical protein